MRTTLGVPSLFEKYGSHDGACGRARIRLSCINSSRTEINTLETKAPMLVQRALYPDTILKDMAHIYLMSSAGGVLQGDRLDIDIEAEENVEARITTQSATKIYRMEEGYALQRIKISAARGSYLEFMPRQLIPFRSSRYFQDVSIKASSGSCVVYSETISAGRIASGEQFDFDACYLRMRAYDSDNRLLFSDVCSIEPSLDKKETFARLFGGKTIWATIYIVTPKEIRTSMEAELLEEIKKSSMLAGCTTLPNESGLIVRMLDDSIDRVEELMTSVTRITRNSAIRSNASH